MAAADFVDQLKSLGFDVTEHGDGKVSVRYVVESGKFVGTSIRLGFAIPGDFPLNPPSGPHISPRLLPMNNQGGPHPTHGIHDSPFGADWQYWSRPMPNWADTKRSVRDVMAHVRHLFDTQ